MKDEKLKKGTCIKQGYEEPYEYYCIVRDLETKYGIHSALVERTYYDTERKHPCCASSDYHTHYCEGKRCFKVHIYSNYKQISRVEYLLKTIRDPKDMQLAEETS